MPDNFIEEITPVLGSNNEVEDTPTEGMNWDEEKTILIDDGNDEFWLIRSQDKEKISISSFPFLIGRSKDADLILYDGRISRRHALINKSEQTGQITIEDLSSSNGIRVNNYKTKKVIINTGDKLQIGDIEYTYHSDQIEEDVSQRGDDAAILIPDLSNQERNKNKLLEFLIKKKNSLLLAGLAGMFALYGIYYFSVAQKVSVVKVPQTTAEVDSLKTKDVNEQGSQGIQKQVGNDEGQKPEQVILTNTQKSAEGKSDLSSAIETEQDINSQADTPESGQLAEAGVVRTVVENQSNTSNPINETSVSLTQSETAQTDNNLPKEVEKPKPIRRSPEWSRNYIQESLDMYLNGDPISATKRLGILSRSSRHQRRFRDEAASLQASLERLQQKYTSGKSYIAQGQRDEAFRVWQSYLADERSIFPSQRSSYALDIQAQVINEYTRRGDQAYSEGRWHDAYRSWQTVTGISPVGEAANSLVSLKERAKERYREGYLEERVNIVRAKGYWTEVLSLVPPEDEYHIKAKAKLKLYENYG